MFWTTKILRYVCFQPQWHNDLGKLVASMMLFNHAFSSYRHYARMNHCRGLTEFRSNRVHVMRWNFYRSSAGTVSMCSFYLEFRTKHVETPLYLISCQQMYILWPSYVIRKPQIVHYVFFMISAFVINPELKLRKFRGAVGWLLMCSWGYMYTTPVHPIGWCLVYPCTETQ